MSEKNGDSREISRLLREWDGVNNENWEKLVPLVYEELRLQAKRLLAKENQNRTIDTTSLVHEAFIKLFEQRKIQWDGRPHFFWLASEIMRRILTDYARRRHRVKRGGEFQFQQLHSAFQIAIDSNETDLIELDDALVRLREFDEQQEKIVQLRYFAGLTIEETAETLGISPATVKRDWQMAKAWLRRQMSK